MLTDVLPLAEALAEGDRGAAGRLLDEFAGWPRTADTILVLDRQRRAAGRGRRQHCRSGSALAPHEPPGPERAAAARGPGSLIAAGRAPLRGPGAPADRSVLAQTPLGTLVIAEEVGVDDAANLARLSGSRGRPAGRRAARWRAPSPWGMAAEVGAAGGKAAGRRGHRGRAAGPAVPGTAPAASRPDAAAGRLLLSSLSPETRRGRRRADGPAGRAGGRPGRPPPALAWAASGSNGRSPA